MSLDEEAEQQLYDDLDRVLLRGHKLLAPWAKYRERVFKNLIIHIMLMMGWDHVRLEKGDDDDKPIPSCPSAR